jgi:membrane fusion protein (multidrug efflux system)
MKKRYAFLLAIVLIAAVVGSLVGIKALQIRAMIGQGQHYVPPPETVTAAKVQVQSWETLVTAVGSLDAVQGVTITAEVTGKISQIAFRPGTTAAAGDLLVQQDISVETAQLRAAEAAATLARINFERERELLNKNVSPRSDYDNAQAQMAQSVAQADNIKAIIARKTIRAPFAGQLGLRQVNLGQVVSEGQPIVSLQALDTLFANFLVPQQELAQMQPGYQVRITTDGLPDRMVSGTITAINPDIDPATRSIKVQATLVNPDGLLRPGMYVNVAVVLPEKRTVLTIPATAVLYAPYSDSVFVIEKKKDEKSGAETLAVRQQFVRLGEQRGDFITVDSGLKGDETVVSTGAFKLRNGQSVVIDNKLAPEFKLAPKPPES